jgi:hypothetical protein
MNSGLIITLAVLAAEIGLLLLCRRQLKRPVNPMKPKLLPYGALMIFLALGIFVTLAHTISLVTGVTLAPKTSKMMR